MNERALNNRLAEVVREHPAILDAAFFGADRKSAYIVPDPASAPAIHLACEFEQSNGLDDLSWHDASGQILVAQLNRTETDFLYREIFIDDCYMRHGICLPDDAVVLDVGANIGMFTLRVAAACSNPTVIAVEPIAELARAIRINALIHGVNATVYNCAAGAESGETSLTYYPNNTVMSGRFADESEDSEVLRAYLQTGDGMSSGGYLERMAVDRMHGETRICEMISVDQIVARENIQHIDLLKVDVEKGELDVFAGIGDETWNKIQQLVIEVHDIDGRLKEVLHMLERRNFEVTHEQDSRLALTPCHNVYARRKSSASPARRSTPTQTQWPSRRALAEDVESWLSARVPDISLETVSFSTLLPTNDHDKGNNRASGESRPHEDAGYSSVVKEKLQGIWKTVLSVENVTAENDFFDLGGDSLKAIRLLEMMSRSFEEDLIEPDVIFTTSAFGEFCHAVETALAKRAA